MSFENTDDLGSRFWVGVFSIPGVGVNGGCIGGSASLIVDVTSLPNARDGVAVGAFWELASISEGTGAGERS
jgi:hypothetical protein